MIITLLRSEKIWFSLAGWLPAEEQKVNCRTIPSAKAQDFFAEI